MNAIDTKRVIAPLVPSRHFSVRSWITASVLAIAVLWFSLPTLLALHPRWVDFGYTHGYLIVVLTAVLAVKAIRTEPLTTPVPSLLGSALLMATVVVVLAARAATVQLVAAMGLPVFWFAAIWAMTGWRNARILLLPLCYFYFAVPIWDLVNGGLQSLTVAVVSSWVRLARIPAFIDGNMIHIPAGTFEVEGGCSGLHYLLVSLALGAYLGLARHQRWASRFALLGLALVTGLVANWIRVFSVIVAGHLTEMQHFLIVKDHYYFGWVLFLILCLVPLALLDRRLPDLPARTPPPAVLRESAGPAAGRGSALLVMPMVLLVTLIAGIWLQGRIDRVGDASPVTLRLPSPEGWQFVGDWNDVTTPAFSNADSVIDARFSSDSGQITYYVAAYAQQTQGHELVYYANRPAALHDRILGRTRIVEAFPAYGNVVLSEIEVGDEGGKRRLLWFGRRVAGRWAESDLGAKLWQAYGALMGRHDALAVVLSADCDVSCEAARNRLTAFATASGDGLFDRAD